MQLDQARNYVFGPNGAGKTSLLEGAFLLGRGRSFRTRQTARLVQKGRAGLSAYAIMTGGERLGVSFLDGVLQCKINGETTRSLAELSQLLRVHVIDPSSHELIEGGPSVRRRYLDASVFHVEHHYLAEWRTYRRVLGQRNALLKRGMGGAGLDVWTRQLVATGEKIDQRRSAQVAALGQAFSGFGERLLSQPIVLEYRCGWRRGATLGEALDSSRQRDREAGFTQVGPHRADLVVQMAGQRVRDVASRGQQKLIAAALVLAQVQTLAKLLGHGGLLLIDDPAAELDSGALRRLLSQVEALRAQVMITAIAEADLPAAGAAAVFHVEQGKVKAMV